MEQIERFRPDLTRDETIHKVAEINAQIDSAHIKKLSVQEIDALKIERENMLRLIDKDFDAPTGEEIGKKTDRPQKVNSITNKELGDSDGGEIDKIKKELANKESLLSKTMENLRKTEDHIEKLKKDLEDLQKMKESEKRNEAIEIHEASLKTENDKLEKLNDRVKKIVARLNEED